MKQCKLCKKSRESSCFYPHPTNQDGLTGKCKFCLNIEKQERKKATKSNMNHRITSVEAATFLAFLEKIKQATRQSVVISTMIGIDRKEIQQIESLIKRLGKPPENAK